MVRIRLLITSPHHPPTLAITVAANSASSSAPASHSAVRSASGAAMSPERAPVTVAVARPIRKGTGRPATAGRAQRGAERVGCGGGSGEGRGDGVGGATDQEGHGQARHGGQDRTGDDRQVQRVQLAREPGDAQQGGHPSTVDERPRPTPHGATLRNVRSRRLLVTTKTLEKAIAAPASIGFSSPRAATGIAAAL